MNTYKLSDFDYNLPKELIAQYPIKERGTSRLLVVNRNTEEVLVKRFIDLIDFLNAGDVVVLNNTKVLKARLIGKTESGVKIDVLLINKISEKRYEILIKPLRKLKDKERLSFNPSQKSPGFGSSTLTIPSIVRDSPQDEYKLFFAREGAPVFRPRSSTNDSITAEFKKGKDGKNYLEFNSNGLNLNEIATMPLPPYIKRLPEEMDFERYQTVYAKNEGAIASPTAGLHFTKEILDSLIQKGIRVCYITSNIGYSTFKKVRSEDIKEHKLEPEYFTLSRETAEILNEARQNKKKILSVGTSSTRVLETCFRDGKIVAKEGYSDLFIYPPFKFNVVNILLTNFHMPKTTLLMLASAFCGRDLLFRAYDIAIKERFRFLSYGDAMVII
ncbi:MAG: tRNA preQ1(34) S-adenosylmethionine ribosyltransferase-isomerase QueA [Candidatus Omnitrophica bacterium]|nr:tRNA preQ1(34) S-adenosylmethionine ribosyltransferase-isomerase QueA [Candidatus Omnitrophota bacterium]